jgi:hypothetical protein
MDGGLRRRALVAAVAVAAAVLAAVLLSARDRGPSSTPERVARDAPPGPQVASRLPDDAPAPGLPPADAGVAPAPADAGDPLADEEHNAWAAVDLETVRQAMPDNIYWRMSAPTKDPEVLRVREEERARWNEAYGRVLSNTATEEEILAYYAHRDRLASDYVQFATYILENYGNDLSIRDLGLLKVAVELNLARLEEIPRQISEAQERRKAHEQAREAWLRDQADFTGTAPATR